MFQAPNSTVVPFLSRQVASASTPDPLSFIRLQHRVQLGVSAALSLIAHDFHCPRTADRAATVVDYLAREMPLHQVHETIDLPIALEINEGSSEEALDLFDMVEAGHKQDLALAEQVFDGLSALACGHLPDSPVPFVVSLLQLAESLRRHIEWEDRVMLPFVTDVLSPRGRAILLARMAARRSLLLADERGRVS